jgi:hypothetical protein
MYSKSLVGVGAAFSLDLAGIPGALVLGLVNASDNEPRTSVSGLPTEVCRRGPGGGGLPTEV